jgi:hypothetical protein
MSDDNGSGEERVTMPFKWVTGKLYMSHTCYSLANTLQLVCIKLQLHYLQRLCLGAHTSRDNLSIC